VSLAVLVGLGAALGVGLALARREELARMAEAVAARERNERAGARSTRPTLPVVDLSRCLGCATCVAACPEDGVLELVHGQAVVVRAARCVGVAACERECPVDAITVGPVTDADPERADLPAIGRTLEAVGAPGVFLAGEVTGHATIKTAIEHGVRAVREAALAGAGRVPLPQLDVAIVGAGPAGLAAALEARRLGLTSVTLEREAGPGGTVAKYPRHKLVVNEPVELPLHGRLRRNAYHKEELIALWSDLTERHGLDIRYGEPLARLERDAQDGPFTLWTAKGAHRARAVIFAVGRRGAPRRLGVPGEDLAKVAYGLADTAERRAQRVLVVGGGDSAVEAALALAEQPGNDVTLSYRRAEFVRLTARNAAALEAARAAARLRVWTESEVVGISPDAVELTRASGAALTRERLANDAVFVLAGGSPPKELLAASGVSFDPELRQRALGLEENAGAGSLPNTPRALRGVSGALALALGTTAVAVGFVLSQRGYYLAGSAARAVHPAHEWLRPARGLGLGFGLLATAAVALNLLYLLRRRGRFGLRFGALRSWMTLHVVTGVAALVAALLHAACVPSHGAGAHTFWALLVIAATGAVGRALYAAVPRAANGRELELGEALAAFEREVTDSGRDDPFAAEASREVRAMVHTRQWRGTLAGRLIALLGVHVDQRRALARIAARGRARGIEAERIERALLLARRAHRLALGAAHLEDLRALLATWRYIHRWASVLMVALLALHVAQAVRYGGVLTALLGGAQP